MAAGIIRYKLNETVKRYTEIIPCNKFTARTHTHTQWILKYCYFPADPRVKITATPMYVDSLQFFSAVPRKITGASDHNYAASATALHTPGRGERGRQTEKKTIN